MQFKKVGRMTAVFFCVAMKRVQLDTSLLAGCLESNNIVRQDGRCAGMETVCKRLFNDSIDSSPPVVSYTTVSRSNPLRLFIG